MVEPTVWPSNVMWNTQKGKDDIKSSPVWKITEPFIFSTRNAIDVGTRVGGVAHYICKKFDHTYCFDMKIKKDFPCSVIKEKVTHYCCPLGYKFKSYDLKDWRNTRGSNYRHTFKQEWLDKPINIDDFDFKDIDYYKIDTDGSEDTIIAGSEKTIKKYKPLIVIEACPPNGIKPEGKESQKIAEEMLISWGYKIVAENNKYGKDNVMMHESRL